MTPEQAREIIDNATDDEIYEVLDETKDDIVIAIRNSFWSEAERLIRKARAMEYELRSRKTEREDDFGR